MSPLSSATEPSREWNLLNSRCGSAKLAAKALLAPHLAEFFPSTFGRSLEFVAVKIILANNLELKTTTINGPRGELKLNFILHSVKSQRMYLLIRLESNTSYVRLQR